MVVNNIFEKKISGFIAIGLFIITSIVVAGPTSDPVNVSKLAALGLFSFGMIPFMINKFSENYKSNIFKNSFNIVLAFNAIMFLVVLFSKSPKSQNIYGMYGRNTGLITFIAFSIILISIMMFKERKSLERILAAFFLAGLVNVIYGLVENFIGDPIPWNNNYDALLGTFGNPDFAGAFYGLYSGMLLAYILNGKLSFRNRSIAAIIFSLSLICVYWTDTTQGILVALISISLVALNYLHFRFKNIYLSGGLMSLMSLGFASILLGIFQKGPFSEFLYKRSVSLRGVYWDAAFQTGKENLFFGVGLDSFGDWYRRTRSLKGATWLPGPDTITNVAHNYYLDIFASGGILLLCSYVGISLIGLHSSIKILRKANSFDPLATTLIALFIAFQAQAFISIPHIGLAIWGWVLIGMLFSYSRISDISKEATPKIVKKITQELNQPFGVLISIAAAVGFLVAIPPYSADARWTGALNSRDLNKLERALEPSYLNPINSSKLANAVIILEQSKLPDKALKYARIGVKFNPDNFDAWKLLYYVSMSTAEEKIDSKKNMIRLDPLNKNLEKLK